MESILKSKYPSKTFLSYNKIPKYQINIVISKRFLNCYFISKISDLSIKLYKLVKSLDKKLNCKTIYIKKEYLINNLIYISSHQKFFTPQEHKYNIIELIKRKLVK